MASQIFTSKILNDNDLLDVGKVQVNNDASDPKDLVRLSQAETISATAVQTALVSASGQASSSTGYTSEFTQAALDAKQDNLSVDASSTQYLELVNGTALKLKDLGIVKPYKDTSNTTLAEFIVDSTFNGDGTITTSTSETIDKMTFIFLQGASDPAEKAFVYLGTNNGNSDDFVSFSVDYNQGTIRSFFSGTGVGVSYSAGTGSFSLDFGTTASQVGAQTIPIDQTEFNVVNGATVLAILKALESYITLVDTNATGGSATISTRLDSLSGVTGNNMGVFTQGLFTDNSTLKTLLQETEILIKSATQDRAAIRNEFAAADATLQTNIESEESARISAIATEASARQSGDSSLQTGLNALSANLTTEISRASAAEQANTTLINQEVADRVSAVTVESNARQAADTAESLARINADDALQDQINALAGSNIELVGFVGTDGVFDAVETDSRNGESFVTIAMTAGEVVVFDGDVTLLGQDFKTGDELMCKVPAIVAGAMQFSDFAYRKGDQTDITKGNLGSSTIDLDNNDDLRVSPDSISRTQLAASVEADIDDKRSLTSVNTITSDGDTHFVSSADTGAQQNVYFKREQTSSAALTDTARTILGELHVSSNGSGNAAAPSYAHVATMATHYAGSCVDLSMVIAGANFEAVGSATSATQATGVYGTSIGSNLGVNVGGTFVADNAAISNLGVFGYASTDGAGADRGLYGAVAAMDVVTFSGTRTADPVPFNDVAVVADAKYAPAGSKAFYAYGDCVFEGGSVTVPSASSDTDAVNLGDIKGKERIYEFDLDDGVAKVITVSGVDLDKCIIQTTDDNQNVGVDVVRDNDNNEVTITATGGDLTGVRLLIKELSCSVTSV